MLLALAQLGAVNNSIRTSTARIAQLLQISQQTASRRLLALVKLSWVRRTLINRGQIIRITPKGLEELKRVQSILDVSISKKQSVTLRGRLFTGLGEGAYYVRLEGYRKQFRKRLGFDPFPGTLNLELLSSVDITEFQLLKATIGIEIQGFVSGDRSFGPVACYYATINSQEKAAILVIERTHHHPNVVEVIAPINLREQLKISDGDIVTITAHISELHKSSQ
jgi:riboflavin kinase